MTTPKDARLAGQSAKDATVSIGSAYSTAWGFDRSGRDRHVTVSIHYDGSGRITIYRASGTPDVRELATISLTAQDFAAIREAIASHVADPAPDARTEREPSEREP